MLATERCKGQGIDLCIDLRDQDSGSSDDIAHSREQSSSQDTVVDETQFDENGKVLRTVTKKQQRKGIESSIKTHPMLTRRANANSSLENKKFMWNLEVEIAKLIEKRMAIWVSEGRGSKSEDENGFISIDCGTPKDFAYTERTTGINYISDANFTDTGVGYNISSEYNSDNLEQPFLNVRSFPEGSRSCYTLNPDRVNTVKFLIRASFMYGNYDGQNKLPRFGLLLEADEWDSVQFEDASTIVFKEIIHVSKKNYIDVCLVNTGFGTPFISALELRPLKNDSYPTNNPGISLLLFSRLDVGSMVNDKENFRLKDDVYDRIWSPYTKSNWVTISSPFNVNNSPLSTYFPPSTVMQTAAMPANGSNSLVIDWEPSDPTSEYFAYFYFAEIDQSQADKDDREVDVYFNGQFWGGPYNPHFNSPLTVYAAVSDRGQRLEYSFHKSKNSTLPPILNGIELHQLKPFLQLLTNQQDSMFFLELFVNPIAEI
ncbi:hypothetical protein LWI29_003106 [Acer saccharum]|nr:hypothetical protein LWI29_003106 [Acer saccharum]